MTTNLIKTFMDACSRGDIETVSRMISNGFIPSPEHEGEPSPLIIAIEDGHFELAKAILKGNVDVNYKDDMGTSALQAAACISNLELVRMLGAKNTRDFTGSSVADYARSNGRADIADIIEQASNSENRKKQSFHPS